jgi:hypothetical protein
MAPTTLSLLFFSDSEMHKVRCFLSNLFSMRLPETSTTPSYYCRALRSTYAGFMDMLGILGLQGIIDVGLHAQPDGRMLLNLLVTFPD